MFCFLLQTISANAFQRDVRFVNFDMKRFLNRMRVENLADIFDPSAPLTEEMCVRMSVTVVSFLPFSVGSDLQNVAHFHEKRQIAIHRTQADIRDLLANACEDHVCIGVVVTAVKIPEDRIPLFGIFQHRVNRLSMLGIIPVLIIPQTRDLSIAFLKIFKFYFRDLQKPAPSRLSYQEDILDRVS